MKNEIKKASAAGKRKQAEWDQALAYGKSRWMEIQLDQDHEDAREMNWKQSERLRIAAKKAQQAENKAKAEAARKAAGEATCQICGRQILAGTGVIAHHGYERPGDGWQTPSCLGARFRPYEVACDRIPEVITMVADHIAFVEAGLAAFLAEPPAVLTYQTSEYSREPRKTIEVPRPADFKHGVTYAGIPHSYATMYAHAVYRKESDIRASKEIKAGLEERLANWKAVA